MSNKYKGGPIRKTHCKKGHLRAGNTYSDGYCITCAKDNTKIWKEKNLTHVRAYSREFGKKWRKANREKVRLADRRNKLKRAYGLSLIDFERMMKLQNRKCAICEKDFTAEFSPRVDHKHDETKMV